MRNLQKEIERKKLPTAAETAMGYSHLDDRWKSRRGDCPVEHLCVQV